MFQQLLFNGVTYTIPTQSQEDPGYAFSGLARAYKSNGVIYACIQNRIALFSESAFAFRRRRSTGPAGLFSNADLRILETPWVGGTTGDLLARNLLYADLAGNAYTVRRGQNLTVLRPDWVTIIGGVRTAPDATVWNVDATVLGYAYQEGGPGSGKDPVIYLPEEVAHFAPSPDPEARFRGMSPLSPIVREIMGDNAARDHKLKFFENAATPQLAVKLDVQDLEIYKKWIETFNEQHGGVSNAYKTLFLGAGADTTVVGANLQQVDFKVTQGAGETRIAAALGVPPVIVGLSEGLAAATYSNYAQARRRFADQTIRPLWRNICGSLANIITVPPDAQLWYDDRDIPALQEDLKDRAQVAQLQSVTIKQLVDAGYDPPAVIDAVTGEDFSVLKTKHTGLFSVQLQPPTDPNALPAPTPQKALPPPQREVEPTNLTIHMPDMHFHPPDVHVDAPITVEPARFERESIRVDVSIPEQKLPELPTIEVKYEEPKRRSKRFELPSGERGTVTEGDGEVNIEFDDGRTGTVKETENE
jgi:HK97 family phage portal protein